VHPVVAVAGEVLTDLVPAGPDGLFRAAPGGSPANVAIGLVRLGVPARMLARLSDDVLGARLRQHLAANDVDLTYAVAAPEPSSLAIVALQPDGSAAYDFRVDGTADWQWTAAEVAGVLDGVSALHVGSLAVTTPPGGAVLRDLARRAAAVATVSYDPNARPLLMGDVHETRRLVEEMVRTSDVVKVSADDVAWLVPGREPGEVAAEWAAEGPALVVVTLGGAGALASGTECGPVERPGVEVAVVDTVGAGDSFTSALLAGLARRDLLGADRRDALRRLGAADVAQLVDEAVLASAITCTRAGADPPRRGDIDAWRIHPPHPRGPRPRGVA
jgi:fructokinase